MSSACCRAVQSVLLAVIVTLLFCRVTIGTVQQVDYAVTSSLAADVAALQNDVAGIDASSVKQTRPLARL